MRTIDCYAVFSGDYCTLYGADKISHTTAPPPESGVILYRLRIPVPDDGSPAQLEATVQPIREGDLGASAPARPARKRKMS